MNVPIAPTRLPRAFPSMVRSGAPGGHARRASMRTSLAVLALASMITIAVSACGSSEAAPGAGMPPPPEVSVATVLSKPVHQWDTFNGRVTRSEEHTSELQSLMRISYDVFCLKKNKHPQQTT